MMSQAVKMLHEDPPPGLGKTDQVVQLMEQDSTVFDEVFVVLLQESPTVKTRAANALEKVARLHPTWLQPHRQSLLAHLPELSHPFSVKMAAAGLLGHAAWSDEDVSTVITTLQQWLQDTNTFVKVNCLQALTQIAQCRPWLAPEVIGLVENEMAKGKSAIQARGRRLLKQLRAM